MEKLVLPKPAVAEVLEEKYVEARLHTDDGSIPTIERIREVQARFAESIANPIYVTVDPDQEKRLGRFEGATLTASDEERFLQFLTDSVAKSKSSTKVVRR